MRVVILRGIHSALIPPRNDFPPEHRQHVESRAVYLPKREIAGIQIPRITGMPKRAHVIVVLLAWFLSTGAHWDLVQTFGWGRMIAKYAQIMPLAKAVEKTFSGELCSVCEVVNDAKQQEQEAPIKAGQKDVKFVMTAKSVSEFIILAAQPVTWALSELGGLSFGRSAPPSPPPRV
jgi:hypothetical protein